MTDTAVAVNDRATFVRERLVSINKSAGDLVYENGLLLREYMANAYFKEDGFKSFDAAIDSMQDSGMLDYGSRNARNFIAIVDLFDALHLPPGEIQNIGISKLREIAMLADPKEQKELLDAAKGMTVAEVQKAAKQLKDKAMGRDVDPFDPVLLKFTASQNEFFKECLTEGRRIYAVPDTVSDSVVLTDSILSEWHNSRGVWEAEQIEASQ